MNKKYIYFICVLTMLIIISITQLRLKLSYASSNESAGGSIILSPLVQVLITGAIKTPGIYRLPEGSRVSQLIQLAGGLLPEADVNSRLLNASVLNGSRLDIKRKNEKKHSTQIAPKIEKGSLKLKTVTVNQLAKLPGIGKKLAQRIISYRNTFGGNLSLDDLKKIDGIGKKRIQLIAPFFK